MGLIAFDWGVITATNPTPLAFPWWAVANIGVAVVFLYWFLVPILYVGLRFFFRRVFFAEHTHAVFQRLVQCLPTPGILAVLQ
ncbi:hypothetical protein BJV78DRAFT_1246298 [Lactifluus subvellereus]|nr:hypothetical protein BJV78DRAFT_1246298 [Lactifluus subvellereus]